MTVVQKVELLKWMVAKALALRMRTPHTIFISSIGSTISLSNICRSIGYVAGKGISKLGKLIGLKKGGSINPKNLFTIS